MRGRLGLSWDSGIRQLPEVALITGDPTDGGKL